MNTGMKVLGAVLLAVVLVAAMAGCAKKPATPPALIEPGSQMPSEDIGTDMPDEAADGVAGEPGTLAEALKTVTLPETVAMTGTGVDGKEMTQLLLFKNGKPAKAAIVHDSGTIFVDLETKEALAYDPNDKIAMKLSIDDEGEDGADMPVLDTSGLPETAKIIATENVGGAACWVVKSKMTGAEGEGKFWVDKKTGLLHKAEMEGDTVEFTFERLNEVAASEFELPEGIEVMDLSGMSGGND
jgi:outer membrane lipoprotein-sorting protein